MSTIAGQLPITNDEERLPSAEVAFPVVRRAAVYKRLSRRFSQIVTALATLPAEVTYWRALSKARARGVLTGAFDLRSSWPVAAKHLGCYLSPTFSTADRLLVLQRTYEVFTTCALVDLAKRRRIWTFEGTDLDIAIWLGPPMSTPMEGEAAFIFTVQGSTIYTVTWAVAPGSLVGVADEDVILIGGLQGMIGCRSAIRLAAKTVGEVAPQDLLLIAMRVVAHYLAIEKIYGLGSMLHVSFNSHPVQQTDVDYDEMWTRKDAVRTERGFFALPQSGSPPAHSSHSSSEHRRRARRKRELKKRLYTELAAGLQECFLVRSKAITKHEVVITPPVPTVCRSPKIQSEGMGA